MSNDRDTTFSKIKRLISAALEPYVGLPGTVSSQGTTIAGHTTTLASHTTELADHESRISTNTSNVSGNTIAIADHSSRLTAIEGRLPLSQSETDTGMKWVDGKTIYRRIVSTGALPATAASSKTVAHSIVGMTRCVRIYGWAWASAGPTNIPLPFSDYTAANCIGLWEANGLITINVGTNRSAFTESWVILEYVK